MHIAYEPNDREVYPEKVSLSEKFWQFVRFTVVTGMIFTLSFLAINYTAYSTIVSSFVNPEAQAEASEVLTQSAGEVKHTNEADLLPTLPEKREVRKEFAWYGDFAVAPTDDRIIIPKIGKSVPLVDMSTENIEGEDWAELEKQIQKGLQDGVVHYPGTAKPGQFGNVFITGHSSYYPWDPGEFKDVFALLGQLEVGDKYYIYYDQVKYAYEIKEKFEVTPDVVSVLEQPKNEKISTLMTCTPVGTTLRRLILKAEQIS